MDRPGNMEGAQSSFGKKDGQEMKRSVVTPRSVGNCGSFFPRRSDQEEQRLCGAAECICKAEGMDTH